MTQLYKLYCEYEAHHCGGEREDESNPFSDRSTTYIDFRPLGISLEGQTKSWRKEGLEIDFKPELGQEVYLIVVIYSDGDTFGSQEGCYQFLGIYDSLERSERVMQCVKDFEEKRLQGVEKKTLQRIREHIKTRPFFPAWTGYFAKFTAVKSYKFKIGQLEESVYDNC